MDNLLSLVLEAHHPKRNHHRRYEIVLGKDLLDDWTVKIRFGRSGQYGRLQQFASANQDEIRAVIQDRLSRRLSAPRRIGCRYHIAAFTAAEGVDSSGWIPSGVLSAFTRIPHTVN